MCSLRKGYKKQYERTPSGDLWNAPMIVSAYCSFCTDQLTGQVIFTHGAVDNPEDFIPASLSFLRSSSR